MKGKTLVLLILFVFSASIATGIDNEFKVAAVDSSGNPVEADKICVGEYCEDDREEVTFLVRDGWHDVVIEDSAFNDVEDTEYVWRDHTKTYTLKEDANEPDKYEFTVKAERGGDSVKVDKICVNGECTLDQRESTFLVEKGYHNVKIEDADYDNVEDSEYISRDYTKTYALIRNVDDEDPHASLDITPEAAEVGELVTFDASSSFDEEGDIVEFKFDFDNDGVFEETDFNDGVVEKSFDNSYSGLAKVKVFDEAGNSEVSTASYDVEQPVPETGDVKVTVEDDEPKQLENAYVSLKGLSNDDLRTGNTNSQGLIMFDNLQVGDYLLSAECKSFDRKEEINVDEGSYSDNSKTIRILHEFVNTDCGEFDSSPTADFDWSPLLPNVGEEVSFDGTLSSDDDDIISYEWEFGDGDEEVGSNPSHVFNQPGDYEVTLTVEDSSGQTDQLQRTVHVTKSEDEGPSAEFSFEPVSPKIGEKVVFDASDSSDDESIVDYSWSFGDGSDGEGKITSNIYENDGAYPVTLTVEDNGGNKDTAMQYVDVKEGDKKCGISRSDIEFSLEDYVISDGDSTDAEVKIFNNAEENQLVNVRFKLGQNVVEEKQVVIQGLDSRTLTIEVSPDEDTFVRAEVKTEGDACGHKAYDLAKELIVLSDSDEEATLDVEVNDVENDPISNARVEVDGSEDSVRFTDVSGEVDFSLKPGEYSVEVSHPNYESEDESVSLSEGEIENLGFQLVENIEDGKGTFQVFVEDGNTGDRIEDAEVEIDGPEHITAFTDDDGFTSFHVIQGLYDIEVSSPEYETISTDVVEVEENEIDTRTYRLYQEIDGDRGIEITNTDTSNSVCRGNTLPVDVTIENRDNRDEYVTVTGTGLGSNIVLDGFVLEEGERKERRVRFTNAEGSGIETFKIQAKNGTRDSLSRSVIVEDCTPSQPPTQDPSGISMKLSYPISPNKALVGDTVKVSGFVDGVDSRTEVEIDVNGDGKARVSTQPDGYYQTYIRADSVGMKTVRARSGGQSASRQLHVLPTANVGLVEAPRKAFEGETFEVCTEVRSQVDAKVVLREDGRLLESTNDRGRVCLDVEAQDPGKHVYEVGAYTSGDGSSSKTTVEVLETDVEVESFPDQVASVESGSGMIKVDLYNTKNQMTRYNLDVEGLPSTWLSQSEKQVVLSPGERKEVFFYLTPREKGRYDPEVIVEARNQEIFRQTVDLETGGQNAPRERGLVQRLRDVFSF